MKKIIVLLLSVVVLTGCSTTSNSNEISVLSPTGAPALAFVNQYENIVEDGTFDLVDGSDQLVAELTKTDSKYDVIIAPINLGTKLMADDQTDYKLAAVVTWGNLYLVGTNSDALNGVGEISLFGNASVPQKIYDEAGIDTSLEPVYYQSATLVQQQLLAGKSSVGMLAEPLASATVAQAKNNDLELEIITDLQSEYGDSGYPQAAVFVKEDSNYQGLIDNAIEFTSNDYPDMQSYLEDITVETLKLPSVEITMQSLSRQNVRVVEASEVTSQISEFLELFDIEFTDNMIVK